MAQPAHSRSAAAPVSGAVAAGAGAGAGVGVAAAKLLRFFPLGRPQAAAANGRVGPAGGIAGSLAQLPFPRCHPVPGRPAPAGSADSADVTAAVAAAGFSRSLPHGHRRAAAAPARAGSSIPSAYPRGRPLTAPPVHAGSAAAAADFFTPACVQVGFQRARKPAGVGSDDASAAAADFRQAARHRHRPRAALVCRVGSARGLARFRSPAGLLDGRSKAAQHSAANSSAPAARGCLAPPGGRQATATST